jgi:hypothetical protein
MTMGLHHAVGRHPRNEIACGPVPREPFDVACELIGADAPDPAPRGAQAGGGNAVPGVELADPLPRGGPGRTKPSPKRRMSLRQDAPSAAPRSAGADDPRLADPSARPHRPSDMRLLHLWKPPNMRSSYRVDFFNTFARNEKIHKVCQRSIITSACCAEEAREIAEARFAELEGVRHWSIHAAEVEVVPIGEEPAAGGDHGRG